jgi:endonuclease/exonuclease/phosphatase family metal-dependent hydrolase
VAEDGPGPLLTVMTRNLYLGTGLDEIVGVSSLPELVAAVDDHWATVLANDFPTRAGALAEEIASARPDVVGLQEVTMWRAQSPSDIRTHPGPNASDVVLDLLAVLLAELDARGAPYTTVATSTNADLEVARSDAATHGLVDVRITDRDAILVRSDVAARVSNPLTGHYSAVRALPSWPGQIVSTRGWASIDYSPDRRATVRILTTHLEVRGPRAGRIQEQQAREAVALIAASPHPVIALGDFNAAADGSTDTYAHLTEVLDDAWVTAHPADPGPTCCQSELLDNAVGEEDVRLDLVLVPIGWRVTSVTRSGAEPFRAGPPPLWASDHLGVTAVVRIPR